MSVPHLFGPSAAVCVPASFKSCFHLGIDCGVFRFQSPPFFIELRQQIFASERALKMLSNRPCPATVCFCCSFSAAQVAQARFKMLGSD